MFSDILDANQSLSSFPKELFETPYKPTTKGTGIATPFKRLTSAVDDSAAKTKSQKKVKPPSVKMKQATAK